MVGMNGRRPGRLRGVNRAVWHAHLGRRKHNIQNTLRQLLPIFHFRII